MHSPLADVESRIAELHELAKEARDQMEIIMRKSEVMHYKETDCAKEIVEGQMTRLNTHLSMTDAETRNMTKKEKKDRKETLKKLKENASALRRRISRLADLPPEDLKKNERRLNVEYFLLVRQSEEAIPALGVRGWFTESAAAKGVSVKPMFRKFDDLVDRLGLHEKLSTSPNLGDRGRKLVEEAEERFEINGGKFVFEEFFSDMKDKLMWEDDESRKYLSEFLRLVETEEAIDSLQTSDRPSAETSSLQNTSSTPTTEPSVASPLTTPHSQTTSISPTTTTEPTVAAPLTTPDSQTTSQTTSISRSTSTSAKMRQCANECCGQIEAISRYFGVCEICRDSRRLHGRRHPRSFYCSESCLRADWAARHREYHELRSDADELIDSEIDLDENIDSGLYRARLDSVD